MAESLGELEARRTRVLEEMRALGDMRRGSIVQRYRRCGKHPCCCEGAEHPGHGPYHSLTYKTGGKTLTRHLAPGSVLDKARREIAAFRKFERLVAELVAVNQIICEVRPADDAESVERRGLKKKSLKSSKKKSREKSST
jgi:hypothetical protein